MATLRIKKISDSADASCAFLHARSSLPPLDLYLTTGGARGLRWTPLRRQVLEMLWKDDRPRGPYDLADEMGGNNRRIYPNSVYRVLNLLDGVGLVVPIVSSRRVRIVPDPSQRDWAVLHCLRCRRLDLAPFGSEADAIRRAAADMGFDATRVVVECSGHWRACRPPALTRNPAPITSGQTRSVVFEPAEVNEPLTAVS